MKIFTAAQIREADAFTIREEPVSSTGLMERAAGKCAAWLEVQFAPTTPVYIFCGKGNNGGDGLVIARLLLQKGYPVRACILQHSAKASADHTFHLQLLQQQYPACLYEIGAQGDFPVLPAGAVIIDAIFGTGLNKPVEGWMAGIIHQINDQRAIHPVVAIDIPSGLLADSSSLHTPVIQAHHTLSFECYKLAFLLPENAGFTGHVHILPIGLHPDYITQTPTRYHLTDREMIRTIYHPRDPFAHKGTYGHALLIAGSYGKMGAAVLSAKACLRAGVGLLSCHVPQCGYDIMQISEPCAMCVTDEGSTHSAHFHTLPDGATYKTIGIGPGLGTQTATARSLERLLEHYQRPMVIDADALNLLSVYPYLLSRLPQGSILTPHPKEFERLFGTAANDFDRLTLLSQQAVHLHLYILLKGRYTAIACPDGSLYFNSTGNPGMATGGSGDVLTGILTALLAQDYTPKAAVILGAWLHGYAGDLAAEQLSQEAMTATDIITHLGAAFRHVI
ncbi:NAD(P)H-hydrate dehydratase [Chitinophaga nivalis]|uniref:Bifunctional NAD(P)H-hydrate repair enzyme n=1 Tax=Chitinophaga nivalis TaxID=2991709 RepID=A0ABT3IPR2_9BACT|nr:NAD(P)H-hydrate dehydratase [Chitinophaga nivalis]MCW3464350.1 NAD(P)H-hydrate dehydratase [Chitinophaga nivalis]MCW3485959.1 NAD(P)H-hydrate dehydratase [Chitinophaga nivalis]